MPRSGVAVLSGGGLPSDHVLLIDAEIGSRKKGWKTLVENCLKVCENRKITSIAFPALGTGNSLHHSLFIEISCQYASFSHQLLKFPSVHKVFDVRAMNLYWKVI